MSAADTDANETYKQEVLSAGEWINEEFLEEVIGKQLDKKIQVLDFKVNPAVGAGDNYLSILHKVLVEYLCADSSCSVHLVIKGPPTSKLLLHVIEEMGVFHKEITMYSKCLPLMKLAIEKYFPPRSNHIAPNSFICDRPNTLVIEDLSTDNYKMADRRNQLDFDHAKVSLRTLARFHSLSVKLYQEEPELIISVAKESIVEENRETHGKFIDSCLRSIISEVEERNGLSRFSDALRDASNHVWDKLISAVQPSKHLNVLNHGDFWTNNILFKYSLDGSIENAKLIDFQLTRYGTPAFDLLYFLFTSIKPDILENKWNELIEVYHISLLNDMLSLRLESHYSKEQLLEDMRDRVIYAITVLTQILPIILAPPSERFDVNKEDTSLDKNYKNSHYLEVLHSHLMHMENIGFLEDLKTRTKTND